MYLLDDHMFLSSAMVLSATPGMELYLVRMSLSSGFLLTLKSLSMSADGKLPLCPGLCHHSEEASGLCAHLSHISEPICAHIRCLRLRDTCAHLTFSPFILFES